MEWDSYPTCKWFLRVVFHSPEIYDLRFQVLGLHWPQKNLLNIFSNQMDIYECTHAVERRPSFWMDEHNIHPKFRAHTPPPSTFVSQEHQCFQNFGHFFLWDYFQDIAFSWANCFLHFFWFCSICSMPFFLMTTGDFWLIWQRERPLLCVLFFFPVIVWRSWQTTACNLPSRDRVIQGSN